MSIAWGSPADDEAVMGAAAGVIPPGPLPYLQMKRGLMGDTAGIPSLPPALMPPPYLQMMRQ